MKLISISIFILFGCIPLHAKDVFKGFSVGATGGYSNYQTFTGEAFFQINLNFGGRAFEPKAGLSYHTLTTKFDYVDNLKMENAGLFLETTIYPFRKYLFTGVRLEVLNFYWFTDRSMSRLNETPYDITNIFWGGGISGVIGVNIPLSNMVSFRMYAMPGVRVFVVSDGHPFSRLYDHSEEHNEFAFQVNAGLVVKIFNK